MQRWVWFEVVARDKMDSYQEWFNARNKIFQDLGVAPWKMYQVRGRTFNLVCVITPDPRVSRRQPSLPDDLIISPTTEGGLRCRSM